MRKLLLHCIAILLLAASASAVKLKFRYEECMTYMMAVGNPVYGSFLSLADHRGNTPLFDLIISAPSGNRVHQEYGKSEGKYHFVPYEDGRYRFCLTLSNARQASTAQGIPKEVIWDFHVSYYHAEDSNKQNMKESDSTDLWHWVNQVDAQIQQLRATQQYLYWRERRHRETVDSTNGRVWWSAVTRCSFLILVSAGQVYFIRRMFSK